uniref:Uncharacterized protein n=1 Tax=Sphaerodactylus townsendi TaxID=933632 RepID=A0ACB8EIL0_9SAUR
MLIVQVQAPVRSLDLFRSHARPRPCPWPERGRRAAWLIHRLPALTGRRCPDTAIHRHPDRMPCQYIDLPIFRSGNQLIRRHKRARESTAGQPWALAPLIVTDYGSIHGPNLIHGYPQRNCSSQDVCNRICV